MRLHERTRIQVRIAARGPETDALGGQAEAFSNETQLFRTSLLPDGGDMARMDGGAVSSERIRLLLPADAAVSVGDGAYVNDKLYLVEALNSWTAHREAVCRLLS